MNKEGKGYPKSMTDSKICYSPELILALDKEGKDYPIDPMVLAILNGIKKTGPHGPYHGQNGSKGRSFVKPYNNGNSLNGPYPHGSGPQGPRGPYGSNQSNDSLGPGLNQNNQIIHKQNRRRNGYRNTQQNTIQTLTTSINSIPRRKLYVEDGDAFLANIRNCLARLSSENYSVINSQLLSYEIDKQDTIEEVAKLLHEAAINGVFIVDYYVDIFLSLVKKFPKLIAPLNQRILKQISEPRDFALEEDTLTETRQQKLERYQIANIHIFAELYRRNVYKEDLFRKIIKLLLNKASIENPITLKVLIELMQKVIKSYDVKRRDKELNELVQKLEEIGRDKAYPGIIRFPLLNCIKSFML